ncbi:MAG TPA: methyltransferase domain-containing protein [Actinomycetota bacterium]|nr:methyltransferase domain-containing protein [Actinomycetota bacterium]
MDPHVVAHYSLGVETERLVAGGSSRIEFARTKELLARFLPGPPARVLDVGGGPGWYASWLADLGYDVHLIDPVPLHVEQATRRAADGPSFSAALGDARELQHPDETADVVLLMGPLYHLPERAARLTALREAGRVVTRAGLVVVATISRFAGLLDMMRSGRLSDPRHRPSDEELATGKHINLTGDPEYFTTAYFHHPDEIAGEVIDAGLTLEATFGIEGPGWLIWERWDDETYRDSILRAARQLEQEPTVIGVSGHLLTFARRV